MQYHFRVDFKNTVPFCSRFFPAKWHRRTFLGGCIRNQHLFISLFRKQDHRDEPWDEILNSARLHWGLCFAFCPSASCLFPSSSVFPPSPYLPPASLKPQSPRSWGMSFPSQAFFCKHWKISKRVRESFAPTSCDSQSLCNLPGRERLHPLCGEGPSYFRISANSLTRLPKHAGSLSTPPCMAIAPASGPWLCWHRHCRFSIPKSRGMRLPWWARGPHLPSISPKLIRSHESNICFDRFKHAVLEAHTSGSANPCRMWVLINLQIFLLTFLRLQAFLVQQAVSAICCPLLSLRAHCNHKQSPFPAGACLGRGGWMGRLKLLA